MFECSALRPKLFTARFVCRRMAAATASKASEPFIALVASGHSDIRNAFTARRAELLASHNVAVHIHDVVTSTDERAKATALFATHPVSCVIGEPAAVTVLLPHFTRATDWVQSTIAGCDTLIAAVRDCKAGLVKQIDALKSSAAAASSSDEHKKLMSHPVVTDSLVISRAGVFGGPLSEYILAHILNRERKLTQLAAAQRDKQWLKSEYGGYRLLSSLTFGVLGASGDIGRATAKLLKAFGATVYGVRRAGSVTATSNDADSGVDKWFETPNNSSAATAAADTKTNSAATASTAAVATAVAATNSLHAMLPQIDYLISVLPNTPQTADLLSGLVLQPCASRAGGVVFINAGRGSIISDQSLIHALDHKWLAHAVLDVFNTEPLPREHAFWSHPGITLTPHVAALSSVVANQIVDCFLANLKRRRNGESALHVVDFKRGY